MFCAQKFIEDFRLMRESSPLVHNISNYVAMNFSANALLAAGASPVMSSEPDEVEELVSLASALVINIGCIEKLQAGAMRLAASMAQRLGKPWVLDPVGAGASRFRTTAALELAGCYHPSVIRGNASEILALDGQGAGPKGVDASDEVAAATESASRLAVRFGTVVSVSGPVDHVTDGKVVVNIANGSPLMPYVTAMGCTASALTAAFLAVEEDTLCAASCAMALMGVVGEKASGMSAGPGSLAVNFLDVLHSVEPEEAASMIRAQAYERGV